MRCLRLDSELDVTDRFNWWLGHESNCQTTWFCKEEDCKTKAPNYQYHFTMCTRHTRENGKRADGFMKALDKKLLKPQSRFFFCLPQNFNVQKVLPVSTARHEPGVVVEASPESPAIFLLQYIETPEGKRKLGFFDSGCSSAAVSDSCYRDMDTENVVKGPTIMNVAAGKTVEIPGGEERFWLNTTMPNKKVEIIAIHMPEVTTPFPMYNLTEAFNDCVKFHGKHGDPAKPLPEVPDNIGGAPIDIMFGIRYNAIFPVLHTSLPCGLAIYTSVIKAPDGRQGVLGGPHKSWIHAAQSSQMMTPRNFFTAEMRAVRSQSLTLNKLFKDFQHLEPEEEYSPLHGYAYLGDIDSTVSARSDICSDSTISARSEICSDSTVSARSDVCSDSTISIRPEISSSNSTSLHPPR
jgi:hypothetical protein